MDTLETASAAPGEVRITTSPWEARLDEATARQLALAELIRRHRPEYEEILAEARRA